MKVANVLAIIFVAFIGGLWLGSTPSRPYADKVEVFTTEGAHSTARNAISYCFTQTNSTGTVGITLTQAFNGIESPVITLPVGGSMCLDDTDSFPIKAFSATLNDGATYEADLWETP